MENKATLKEENEREQSAGERYRLFDEKTLNFFLYGTKEVRVLDVNKLKRKAENEQGMKLTTVRLGQFITDGISRIMV